MKLRIALLAMLLMGIWTMAAVAASPIASPEGVIKDTQIQTMPEALKVFGDPTDFKASALAGAQYIRMMQSDITEDNALNGDPDVDYEDAGWDWESYIFEHREGASYANLYGVIANSVFEAYLLDPTPEIFITLQDVADFTLTNGPSVAGQRYAGDMMFLMNFATLPGVVNPTQYIDHAKAIWDWRMANYGDGTGAGFLEIIRDGRFGQGYSNGIIAWDCGAYVAAVAMLNTAFPGMGYDVEAASMAEVLYQDSFMLNPGYFDFQGTCMGADPTGANKDFWWYTLGITGLIQAFETAGVYPAEIAQLEAVLLDCQYDDGAFSEQYGADVTFNDRSYQSSAYATVAISKYASPTTTNLSALFMGGYWLAATQDVSGAWTYGDGSHVPEVGAECAAAVALAWMNPLASISGTFDGVDPVQCGDTKNITFDLDQSGGTPGVRGYELTLQVTGPVDAIVEADFANENPFAAFSNSYFNIVYDAANDYWIINDAILGATGGLVDDAAMVTLTLVANGDGAVDVNVVSLKLRDPDNADIPAMFDGAGFTSDCTAPDAVDTFTGAPGHEKADLAWTMADISDVATFEIYRAVWYDGDNAYNSAYPEYDDLANDVIPGRPGSRAAADASAEWTLIHTAVAGDVAFTDNETVRGIYYYEIFAMDAAGNYGPPAADAVWVMNYWLGDTGDGVYTQFDGEVDVADITALGSYFGMSNIGLNHVGNHVDVGPTHDNSRLGIPSTDDAVDFEDLMIIAMNYNVVSAAKSRTAPGSTAYLAWEQMENGSYVVRVTEGNGLKGLRVIGNVGITGVSAGSLVAEQDEMTFFANVGSALDANIAVMGLDLGFVGSGDLLIINTTSDINFDDITFEARGFDNSKMEISFEMSSNAVMPEVFKLSANYPNPFNPMTTISFSLPEDQAVTLTVYGVDGRKVATLINEQREAGTHDVVWMGRNDKDQLVASGTYFYQINAGPYSQVRKMTLMK